MARSLRSIVHATKSPLTDDLKQIKGIGPVMERRLHDVGIHTFAGLAELSPEQVAALMPKLSAGLIRRQGWIAQARKLVAGKMKPKDRRNETGVTANRQHYETFTLEFLLNEENKTRRLRVIHIQSGDVDTWSNWDGERLVDFLARHTGERISYAPVVFSSAVEPTLTARQATRAEPTSDSGLDGTFIVPVPALEENSDARSSSAPPLVAQPAPALEDSKPKISPNRPPSEVVAASSRNKLRLLEWQTFPYNPSQPSQNILHNQPFQVKLTLSLADISLADAAQLSLTACLYARKLGSRDRHMISKAETMLRYANIMNLTIGNATLPQGFYHLEALLGIRLTPRQTSGRPDVMAFFEGGPLQVY